MENAVVILKADGTVQRAHSSNSGTTDSSSALYNLLNSGFKPIRETMLDGGGAIIVLEKP